MTKEQIKNEAAEYAKGKYGGKNAGMWSIAQIHAGRDGFIAGANWRINSVWHKPEEVPEAGKDCLVEYLDGDGCAHIRIDKRSEYEWIEACHYDRILRWAYIEDLIPTEDETA